MPCVRATICWKTGAGIPLLRVLTARWLGLRPQEAGRFALATATLSELGWEHERPALWLWNEAAA